jgi:hypothetical protein
MRRDGLHGTTGPGVLQEVMVFTLVSHRVRLVMWRSAPLQPLAVAPIRVLDARRWRSAPHTGRPLVAWIVNPARPPRGEPRVKKRRPKPVPAMITPRPERRRQLVQPALSG